VTASGRPASRRAIETSKSENARPSLSALERAGRPTAPHARGRDPDGQPPPEHPETPAPRLQAVTKGPVNEALKVLAADDAPSLSATRTERRPTAPSPPSPRLDPIKTPDIASEDGKGLSLYVDSLGERRVRGPAPHVRQREELEDLYDDDGAEGRPWLKLLLVVALLLTSIYVASPLIEEQFGIDIAALVQDKIAGLTGAPPSPEPAVEAPTPQGRASDQDPAQ
jgi:hypothetical protein